jgi:hypothetical protein
MSHDRRNNPVRTSLERRVSLERRMSPEKRMSPERRSLDWTHHSSEGRQEENELEKKSTSCNVFQRLNPR